MIFPFFPKFSEPFFPIVINETFLSENSSIISCLVFFITLELNAPHNPRFYVIATNKIEFFSRTETK